jgi:hypothetical protein
MSVDIDSLDAAWVFVEAQLLKGIKKKDIVPLLNDAGHRTQKGKLWTYQTFLLEQRRRGESRTQKKDQPRPVARKLAIVSTGKPKKDLSKNNLNTELDSRLRVILESEEFDASVRNALEEGFSLVEVAKGLNELGSFDSKGRLWTEASITHEWTQRITKAFERKDILDRYPLSEIVDRGAPQAPSSEMGGESSKKSPTLDEVWLKIELEMKKGLKNRAIVGALNMGGFLTRRGKPWTYQTLLQEIHRHKQENIGSDSQPEVVRVSQQPSVAFEALVYAKKIIESKLLPKMHEKGYRTPRGQAWTCEVLLWEMLKAGLDLETFLAENPQKWWEKKKIASRDEAPTLFDIL